MPCFYRVIGAIVIIAGLYLVVWGKSKDYNSATPINEQIEPADKVKDTCKNVEENTRLEAIIINVPT